MKRKLLAIFVGLMGGCTTNALLDQALCPDGESCPAVGQPAGAGSDGVGAVVRVGPPPVPPPFNPVIVSPREGARTGDPFAGVNPFASPFLGLDGLSDLLSSVFGGAAAGLLEPVGPRLDESLTFFERICEDNDMPDSFCRQRFSR